MRCLKPGGTFVSYEWCLVRSPPPHATPCACADTHIAAPPSPPRARRRAAPAAAPHLPPRRTRHRAAPAAAPRPLLPRRAHSVLRAVAAQTDKHDPKCEAHLYSKKMIEEGDGLPDIIHTKV